MAARTEGSAMPSPFPGMDPYLEDPHRWPGVHLFLIAVFNMILLNLLRYMHKLWLPKPA